ncbi:MAG: phosphoribosylaminoimidazolesuccinocarboxamide synthase [Chloroflexota bacterium]
MLAESFLRSGKVRDLSMLNDGRLVLVASDRISAFDVVLPSVIPDKGRVLTGMSRFWFAETATITRNHLLDTDPDILAEQWRAEIRTTGHEPDLGPVDAIRGRIMICRPAAVIPIEAVVRGYLAGSGWKEYQEHGTVCGIRLPAGLRESDRLPEPIFTPATKAEPGQHDENITFDGMIEHIGAWHGGVTEYTAPLAEAIRERALRLYRYGAAVAERRGVLLADTKFEFGVATPMERPGGSYTFDDDRPDERLDRLMVIDEALTPDSSRFWDAATYDPGRPQASFDKQFVRDWLETQSWDKSAPGPALPDDVVAGTRARYIEAYERITGASFERYLQEDLIAS